MNREEAAVSASNEAKHLFMKCLQAADPQARQSLLSAADPILAQEVRDLLSSIDQGDVIDRVFELSGRVDPAVTSEEPVSGNSGSVDLRSAAAEGAGTRIGNYKLLEIIGEGGMGTVFMAQQTAPVKRKVAVKIVKPGMDSRQVIARFEAERQALALMDHPNIARVFDGGTTDSGRPYFVMELVNGIPLTDFCERQAMSVRDRLALFADVCQGVQHAHQRGIIHRDLKPSNVLVTLHDDSPVVKIIDFGIAKATSAELTDKTLFTQFASVIGTPLYMSPEQAELSGLDVDTRSDVYSLGVMLYELVTGTTPFDRETLKSKGLDEVRRMIRETDPPRPSQRISTIKAGDAETVNSEKLREFRRSMSDLKGELDWIVMRALEKDRTRRYQSPSEFARDIERFLDGEAVEACPPSWKYRLGKQVRKHRGFLTACATVLLTAIAGTVVSAVYAWQADQKADEAITAKQRADENLEIALDAVDGLLVRVADDELREHAASSLVAAGIMEDAVQLYSEISQRTDEDVEIRLKKATAMINQAEFLQDHGRASANDLFVEAVDQLSQLLEKNPKNVSIATQYIRAHLLYVDVEDPIKSDPDQSYASHRAPLFKALAKANSIGFANFKSRSERELLCRLILRCSAYEKPETRLNRALKARQILLGSEAESEQATMIDTELANRYMDAGEVDTANAYYARGQAYWREINEPKPLVDSIPVESNQFAENLPARVPRVHRYRMMIDCGRAAALLLEHDLKRAKAHFELCSAIGRELLADYPHVRRFREGLDYAISPVFTRLIRGDHFKLVDDWLLIVADIVDSEFSIGQRFKVARREGNAEKIKDLYRQALALEDSKAYSFFVFVLGERAALGEYELIDESMMRQLRDILADAYEWDANFEAANAAYGGVLFRLGEYERARKLLEEKAVPYFRSRHRLRWQFAAMACAKLGDIEQAEAHLKMAEEEYAALKEPSEQTTRLLEEARSLVRESGIIDKESE